MDTAKVVAVGFKGLDFLYCIVIVNVDLVVVSGDYYPLLSFLKNTATQRVCTDFDVFQNGLVLVVVDLSDSRVEGGKNPWVGFVHANPFYLFGKVA